MFIPVRRADSKGLSSLSSPRGQAIRNSRRTRTWQSNLSSARSHLGAAAARDGSLPPSHLTWLEGEVSNRLGNIDGKIASVAASILRMNLKVEELGRRLASGSQCSTACSSTSRCEGALTLPLPLGDCRGEDEPKWEDFGAADSCPQVESGAAEPLASHVYFDLDQGKLPLKPLFNSGGKQFSSERSENFVPNRSRSTRTPTLRSNPFELTSIPSGKLVPAMAVNSSGEQRSPARPMGSRPSLISAEDLEQRVRTRSRVQERLFRVVEDTDSSAVAKFYSVFTSVTVILSVAFALLQTFEMNPIPTMVCATIDLVFEALFVVDILIRFAACPRKVLFFRNPYNVMDVISVLPAMLHINMLQPTAMEDHTQDLIVAIVPGVRLLKTLRRFEKFQLLVEALELAAEGLPVCLFTLLTLTLTFSAGIYLVEPRDNIPTLQRAMWLCINLQTMVGYPGITPASTGGTLIVTCLIIVSVLYLAMPLGIIGNAFAAVWEQRQLRILCHRTRARMTLWGYGPEDVQAVFSLFDEDGEGELNQRDFVTMIRSMGLGMKDEVAHRLFRSLDVDGSGAVDDKEFVAAVFPHALARLYDDDGSEEHASKNRAAGPGAGEDVVGMPFSRSESPPDEGEML